MHRHLGMPIYLFNDGVQYNYYPTLFQATHTRTTPTTTIYHTYTQARDLSIARYSRRNVVPGRLLGSGGARSRRRRARK